MQAKKKYLRKYRESIAAENELNDQLNRLRDDFTFPKAQDLDGMPHGFSSVHDLSDYAARIDNLLLELSCLISSRIDLRKDIMHRIDSMDSEVEKTILMMRYISGKTFEQIAVTLNYSWRWVLTLHGNALDHFPYP